MFSSYFFVSIPFGDGFFQFQDNKVSLKQAPGHNHKSTIFQPGQCHFKANFLEQKRNIASSKRFRRYHGRGGGGGGSMVEWLGRRT